MRLNKSMKLRFMDHGKIYSLRCLYSHNMFGVIPTYLSEDVEDFKLISTSDKLFIIANKQYISNKISDEDKIKICYALLKKYYSLCDNVDTICDTHIAYWFSFTKAINVISSSVSINEDIKTKRITYLEDLFRKSQVNKSKNNVTLSIPNLDTVLNSFQYVEIN